MIEISSIEVEGTTAIGAFRGALELKSGLNILSAENAYGKSLAMTAIPWCLGLEAMFGLQDNDPSRFPLAVRDGAPFRRDALIEHLQAQNIGTRLVFGGNLVRQPAYKDVLYRVVGDLKGSDFVMRNVFWVGLYPGLTEEMLDFVAQSMFEFVQGRV